MGPARSISSPSRDVEETQPGVWRVWLLTAGLCGWALVLWFSAVRHLSAAAFPTAVSPWLLLVAFAVAETTVVHVYFGREGQALSLAEIPLIVGLFTASPAVLVILRVVTAAGVHGLRGRQTPMKLWFNIAWAAVEAQVALVVWHAVLGSGDPVGPAGWLATLAAVGVVDVLGSIVITLAITLKDGDGHPQLLRESLCGGALTAAANTSLGVVVVTMLAADPRSLWAAAVVAAVLALAYRAYHSLRVRHDHIQQLYRFTQAMSGCARVEDLGMELLERARSLLRAGIAELVLQRGEADQHRILLRADAPPEHDAPGSLARDCIGTGLHGPVVLARGHAPEQLAAAGLHDAIVVPLMGGGGTIGTVLVADRLDAVSTFTEDDLQLLSMLAGHAGVTMERQLLVDRLKVQAAINRHQASHDALTGLANRQLFQRRVREALDAPGPAAVLVLGLNRFKEVNDTLGRPAGDQLLQTVAERLRTAVPEGGQLARIGGDEFALLLPSVGDGAVQGEQVAETAARLHAALEEPVAVAGLVLAVRAGIGVALHPAHGDEPEVLLQHAHVAVSIAKEQQRATVIYDGDLDHHSRRSLALATSLRAAIGAGELQVHYQPKVDLVTGAVAGMEALVRWQHPEHGLVAPDEFIPIAEETGLITPLTDLVLEQALEAFGASLRTGVIPHVAVNVSARSLLDVAFPERVAALLERAGVPAAALTIELTETSILADPEATPEALARLDAMGVTLSIDDFGTGYSSLSRLRRLPVHELKIDRSFVQRMAADASDLSVVRSVIELAANLGLRVVAEGVEDDETWRLLRELGCQVAQGYRISPPLDRSALERWLGEWTAVSASAQTPGPAPTARGSRSWPLPRGRRSGLPSSSNATGQLAIRR